MRKAYGIAGVTAALLALCVACAGVEAAPAQPSPPSNTGQLRGVPAPAHGALLGHYYGAGSIEETDARIGRMPAVHLTYYGWSDAWDATADTRDDLTNGRIPLVNWEPSGISFDDIINGKLDATITARADGAKSLNSGLILDFAAEMNEEEGWGGHSPEKYIAAYRHIHDIFTARGATNVAWAWCPNNTDSADSPPALAYYPGNDYVDWTGADGYNWGTSQGDFHWQTFDEVFSDIYGRLAPLGKPIIIGETASDEVGGDKAHWISDMVPTLRDKFPLIKALVWFDVDKERHWQVNSSPSSLAAYRQMANDPYLNP